MSLVEIDELKNKPWWDYLDHDLKELLKEAFVISKKASNWEEKFHDYSFLVFPAAKAYEGFLKNLFLDLKLIDRDDYYGKRFRIGRALNPSLEKKYASTSVYAKLVNYCGGYELADTLWDTWKRSRNLLFHWFPDEKNTVSFEEANHRIQLVIDAISAAFTSCSTELAARDEK